jgi:uncharacterized protein YjbJ (UPF0337 family)
MNIDRDRVRTQEDENEPAPIDKIEDRVQAEMKRIEGSAQERAGQGMQDEDLEIEGRRLKEEGEKELEEQRGDQ